MIPTTMILPDLATEGCDDGIEIVMLGEEGDGFMPAPSGPPETPPA